MWREKDAAQTRIAAMILRRCSRNAASLRTTALTAILQWRLEERETVNAPRHDQGRRPHLFRRSGSGNADYFSARVRGRPHQLGAADALLLARPSLHLLLRARL